MEKKSIDEDKINYDVYNGLNLYSPILGEQYAKFDWNPLGENFRLDIPFIEQYFKNSKIKDNVIMPPFLEAAPDKVLESFKLASKRNKELLDELQTKYDGGEFKNFEGANIEKQVEEMLFALKCRQKMFEILNGQLKSKKIDAFAAYKNIRGLNKKLAQLLEEAYAEEWNKKVALQNMLLMAQNKESIFTFEEEGGVFDLFGFLSGHRVMNNKVVNQLFAEVTQITNNLLFGQNVQLNQMPEFADFAETLQATIPNMQPNAENTPSNPIMETAPQTPVQTASEYKMPNPSTTKTPEYTHQKTPLPPKPQRELPFNKTLGGPTRNL